MTHHILAIGASHTIGPRGLCDDIITIARLGAEPVPVTTALSATAQGGALTLDPVAPTLIADQLNEALASVEHAVVKTGFVGGPEAIDLLTDGLEELAGGRFPIVAEACVLDMRGAPMLDEFGMSTLKRRLLLIPDLLVCTRAEAEALTGLHAVDDWSTLHAAEMLLTIGPQRVFVEGGHEGPDILVDESGHEMMGGIEDLPVLPGTSTAAAIATFLGAGYQPNDAVRAARDVVRSQFVPPLLERRDETSDILAAQ
ncbi:MAG: bifunctional hydroxymethylpyrimidine kinase/phosphomethylpyrimidine kinase [Alphaproteobacteria bacterium]